MLSCAARKSMTRAAAATAILTALATPGVPGRDREGLPVLSAEGAPATADELVERLGNAWFARDFEGYLALWDLDSPEQRDAEAAAVREAFATDETELRVLGRPRPLSGTSRWAADVQIFTATEPRAKVQNWRLHLERRGTRWAFVEKEAGAAVDGLVHLPLDAEAWRVRGVLLRLEDFELRMEDGSLFTTSPAVGPTALVFVGRGRVRFSPRPAAEGEQLRQFSGASQLDRAVKWAFVRLHPGDFGRLLDTTRLEPDPAAGRRRAEALKRWNERASRSFMIDADLPRSPWWLYPNEGDALVDFPWKGKRVLTYVVAGGEAEDVNLFERDRGAKICSYPSAGRPARTRGAPPGDVDVLHHSLIARFDPSRLLLSAVDTLRLRLLSPISTLRLRLHDDFQVSSVSSEDGGSLLFLRVREQGSLVVSLGPHSGRTDEFSLTVRYSGQHDPASVEHELLQLFPEPRPAYVENALLTAAPLVYSNRTAWYPRPGNEDYATLRAHFDTPDNLLAVTGGELIGTRTAEGRTKATYRLSRPGKYFSVVVGHLEDLGMRQLGGQRVRGFGVPRTREETRKRMVTAEELLAFYAERFGPCPYPAVNQAIAEATIPGGHSPPGLVYLQRRPAMLAGQPLPEDPANFGDMPDFFLAHELAHQWWGQGVAPASYREQWLSEAWAQYSAALWVRHRKGQEAFRDMLERMARWAERHDENGPIHLGQRLGHLKHDPRIRRALVYDKGACILHMLRELMGDDAFFGGARSFLERHRYGKATTEDLREALEEASGLDLEPYFERWIYGTGLPTLLWSARTVATTNGHQTTVQVRPGDLPGPLPLEIGVRTGDEWKVRRVALDPAGGSWTIGTAGPVRDVRINENRGILAEAKKVRRLPALPQR
jgi:hypothetical protein